MPKEEKNSINKILDSYLKNNQEDHYNFEQEIDYKVSTGSLMLDIELGGGVGPGVHRACGATSGGKTSETLLIMKNFLDTIPNSRGFIIKSEGRLDNEMKVRSGITFVYSSEEWKDGNCFVFETNIYETAIGALRELVKNNPENKRYFFIIDSIDALIPKEDSEKSFAEAFKVAGGALLGSKFLQKMTLALTKYGHMCWMISQVRSNIKINPYQKDVPRLGDFSGGSALLHYSNLILEFEQRHQKDLILKDDKKPASERGNILGHYAKVKIDKSLNEKHLVKIQYPIKYGRTGGKSIWVEYELINLLLSWDLLNRSGGWYNLSESLLKELCEIQPDCPEKLQGIDAWCNYFTENKVVMDFLINKFKSIVLLNQ